MVVPVGWYLLLLAGGAVYTPVHILPGSEPPPTSPRQHNAKASIAVTLFDAPCRLVSRLVVPSTSR